MEDFYANNPIADWPYLLILVVVIAAGVLYYRHVKKEQMAREKAEHDAYSHTVNDSNYNINREGMDGHRDQGLSREEAKAQIETLKDANQIPTRDEFGELNKDLKK